MEQTPNSTPQDPKKASSFADELRRRTKDIKTTRWLRFAAVSLVFLLWVIWMRTWWLAIFELLLFDIYITGFIPFTWWKKSKSKSVRAVMSWVDAIVYALILVYFVFAFVGQNYQIPSSSLEKTLLTGDYLWVNKMVYGPRVPMTPVNFPLVHNTLFGHKSYLDNPSVGYRRLKGLRSVEEGDIVVFNFPAGDTVATKLEEADARYYDMLVEEYGRERLHSDKATFGDIIYRPVDRRQNFVKRAVGLPGQRLKIVHDTLYIDGVARPFPKNVQFNYLISLNQPFYGNDAHELGIAEGDIITPSGVSLENLRQFLPESSATDAVYLLPMTQAMLDELQRQGRLTGYVKMNEIIPYFSGDNTSYVFPFGNDADWTISDFGGAEGLLIPSKGMTVELTPENWTTYKRAIRNYEGHSDAYFDAASGKVVIDGKPADSYTFAMDYYFMMGDNRDNSQDSRFWGFVPEDHIVGTPMIVLASFDRERGLFDGKIRFDRILRSANPDK